MTTSLSLRTQLALGMAAFALLAAVALGLLIGRLSADRVRSDAGEAALATAVQMGEMLSRGMFERQRDIRIAASLDLIADPAADSEEKRALLETLQATFPNYAWIGIADAQGIVRASTDRLLEGADVSTRPWFVDGLTRTVVKDVHEAVLLAKLLPNPGGDPLRFVDVAAPLRDSQGNLVGVLGAHLSWAWAGEVRDALLRTRSARAGLEILVLSSDGIVLLGPRELVGDPIDLPSVQQARDGQQGHRLETWPDGESYLTAYAPSGSYLTFAGAGWLVLAREPAGSALAAVHELQRNILIAGVSVALLLGGLGGLLARRVSRPVLALAAAADRIAGGGKDESFPAVAGCREVGVLSRSMSELLRELGSREAALVELNASLERRIAERTESLASSNAALERENRRRKTLEVERNLLIRKLQEQASRDALTGVYNRRAFAELAGRELKRAKRRKAPISIVLLDIDHFKQINDCYGHAAGDRVLQQIAAVLSASLREVDVLARYGGEEFVALLTDSDQRFVGDLAERLRQAVERAAIEHEGIVIPVTSSFGAVTVGGSALSGVTLESLLDRADRALYRAKAAGRNRVETDSNVADAAE